MTDTPRPERVDPAYIADQRTAGWPDIHPEWYCHHCGNRNPLWYATREVWLAATSAWAAQTGREGICCPTCFIEMAAEAGVGGTWLLSPPAPTPARVTLTDDEISALVGDDIAFWVGNEFLSREDLLGKVCFWVTRAVAAREDAREAAVRTQTKVDLLTEAERRNQKSSDAYESGNDDEATHHAYRAAAYEHAARIAGGEQA